MIRVRFRDRQTGRPFPWEFHRGKQIIEIAVAGRVRMDDPSAAVAACIAGQRVFVPTRTLHRGICRIGNQLPY